MSKISEIKKKLIQMLKNEEYDIKKKMNTLFATHVKDIDIVGPLTNEQNNEIYEYIKVVTDVGNIYVPIQVVVKDVSYINETAEALHEFATKYILPIFKGIRDIYCDYQRGVSVIVLDILYIVLKVLVFIDEDDEYGFVGKLFDNVQQIKLIADTSDETTYEYVYTDNVKDRKALNKIMTDVLDVLDYLWVSAFKLLIKIYSILGSESTVHRRILNNIMHIFYRKT